MILCLLAIKPLKVSNKLSRPSKFYGRSEIEKLIATFDLSFTTLSNHAHTLKSKKRTATLTVTGI